MRRIWFLLCVILLSQMVYAIDAVPYCGQAIGNRYGAATILAGAQIYIGTETATGIPINPLVTLYSGKDTTGPHLNQPLLADVNGNYCAFIVPQYITIQVQAAGYVTSIQRASVNVGATNTITTDTVKLIDIGTTFNGTPTTLMALVRHPFPFAATIPATCTDSYLIAETGTADTAVFSLQKCTAVGACAEFGTATFCPTKTDGVCDNTTVATFACSTATSFAKGQFFKLLAPETPDDTLALIGGAIYGTR